MVVLLQRGFRVKRRQLAVEDHHHTVAHVKRRHAVRDREQRELGLQRGERVLDQRLGVGVKRAGGLVQHEHPWTRGKRASEADPLLLAPRDRVRARADRRLVAVRPTGDVVVDARESSRPLNRLVVEVAEEADVLSDGGVQQARFLGHVGDEPMPILTSELAHVEAVDQVATRLGRTQLQHDLHERRLAGAGGPDDADRLALAHGEADHAQHRASGVVGKADLLEGEALHLRELALAIIGTARGVAPLGLLQAVDKRQRLLQRLIGGLDRLALLRGAHEQ